MEGVDKLIDARWLFALLTGEAAKAEEMAVVLEGAQKFTLGRLALASTWASYAALRAVVQLAGLPLRVVTPYQWQHSMLLGRAGTPEDTKQASVRAAGARFPHVSLLRTPRCRVADHNIADALLMAAWAQEKAL